MDNDIIESSQPEEAQKYRCTKCGKEYKSRSGLTKHLKSCRVPLAASQNELAPPPTDDNYDTSEGSQQSASHTCTFCAKNFSSKSNLAKHTKNCAESARRNCRYCEATFTSFTDLRAHESRTHKAEETARAGEEVVKTNQEILQELANAEAALTPGRPLYSSLMAATGLTREQIRHRREKPLYKELLDIAGAALPRQRNKIASTPPVNDNNTRPTRYTTRRARENQAELAQVTNDNDEREIDQDGDQPNALVLDGDFVAAEEGRTNQEETTQSITTNNIEGEDEPNRQGETTLRREEDPNHLEVITTTSPLPPQEERSLRDPIPGIQAIYNEGSANEQRSLEQQFLPTTPETEQMRHQFRLDEYLAHMRQTLQREDQNIASLIDEIISHSHSLDAYPDILEAWLSTNLPARIRGEGQRPTERPTRPTRQTNYAQRHTGSSLRADAFKKAQDLYRKDKNLLADIIFSGKNILESSSYPTLQDTERYFMETFEAI